MPLWGGELRGHWDLYLSRWFFKGAARHGGTSCWASRPPCACGPMAARSAWFWEAGIGATLADQRYHPAGQEEFSTRFNCLAPGHRHQLWGTTPA